jgi:transposase
MNESDLSSPELFVGIDVSKDRLDACLLPGGEPRQFANDAAGREELLAWLRPRRPTSIVLESTGGYERPALWALQDAGLPATLVNPRQIRDFARALGQEAKTDRLDAAVLAAFAKFRTPAPSEPTSPKQRELDALIVCRRQLVESRVAHQNRLGQARDPFVQETLSRLIKTTNQEIKAVEDRLAQLLESDDQWRDKLRLLESTPGIGRLTGSLLLAEFPELGRLSRQAVAALAGVAPYARDSGTRGKPRTIRGGRRRVRSILYMAALAARRFNPAIKAFAARLAAKGKAFKVIQIACIRKLLVVLNAILKTQSAWTDKTC